jgi:hypothetical protein
MLNERLLSAAATLAFTFALLAQMQTPAGAEQEAGGRYTSCVQSGAGNTLNNGCAVPLSLTICASRQGDTGPIITCGTDEMYASESGHQYEETGVRYRIYACRQGWDAVDADGGLVRDDAPQAFNGIRWGCRR